MPDARKPRKPLPAPKSTGIIVVLPGCGGRCIAGATPSEVLFETLQAIGEFTLFGHGFRLSGGPLIATSPEGPHADDMRQTPSGNFLQVRGSVPEIKKLLRRIARDLGIPMIVHDIAATWSYKPFIQPELPFMAELLAPPVRDL